MERERHLQEDLKEISVSLPYHNYPLAAFSELGIARFSKDFAPLARPRFAFHERASECQSMGTQSTELVVCLPYFLEYICKTAAEFTLLGPT